MYQIRGSPQLNHLLIETGLRLQTTHKMENHLKPIRFDADPGSPTARQEWRHWFATLQNYITGSNITEEANKYRLLVNFVSPAIFAFISDHTTYATGIKALEDIYDKSKNSMFARHLLRSTRQQPHQSLDEYLRTLRTLSHDCGFTAVSAEEYRCESIRDSFISGINSGFIRQRILENNKLSLEETYNMARTLDSAQRNAESFQPQPYSLSSSLSAPSNVITHSENQSAQNVSAVAYSKSRHNREREKCWFCGKERHPRSECPARQKNCTRCGKLGHFEKMCNSKPQSSASAGIVEPSFIPRLATLSTAKSSYSKIVLVV